MKKHVHWNDKKRKEQVFETGLLASKLYKELIQYLMCDLRIDVRSIVEKHYILNTFDKVVSYGEHIVSVLRDGNSIYALYGVDYTERRIRWLDAKGHCFRMISILDTIALFVHNKANIQKYADLANEYMTLAGKITNLISSDDKKRKSVEQKQKQNEKNKVEKDQST